MPVVGSACCRERNFGRVTDIELVNYEAGKYRRAAAAT